PISDEFHIEMEKRASDHLGIGMPRNHAAHAQAVRTDHGQEEELAMPHRRDQRMLAPEIFVEILRLTDDARSGEHGADMPRNRASDRVEKPFRFLDAPAKARPLARSTCLHVKPPASGCLRPLSWPRSQPPPDRADG